MFPTRTRSTTFVAHFAGVFASSSLLISGPLLASEAEQSSDIVEVVVTSTRERLSQSATIAVPQAIQTVSRVLIEEQQSRTLSDIIRNVSGTAQTRTEMEAFRGFKLRGFDVNDTRMDGVRNTGSLNIQPDGLANIEQVEVLKGPASSLFGSGPIGGTVNIVSKKPASERQMQLSAALASHDFVNVSVDATGPINQAQSVRYRFIGDYSDADTFVDPVSVKKWQVAPSMSIDIADHTVVTLQTDYRSREGLRYVGLPLTGTILAAGQLRIPLDSYLAEPGQGDAENTGWQSTMLVDHEFSDSMSGRFALRYSRNTFNQPIVGPRSDAFLDANGRYIVNRNFHLFDEVEDEWVADAYLNKTLELAGLSHSVVLGADYSDWAYDSKFYLGSAAAIDVLRPAYGAAPTGVFLLDHTLDRVSTLGIYVQDHLELSENLTAQLGLRYDNLDNQAVSRVYNTDQERDDSELTHRIGLVYRLKPSLSVFTGYGSSIRANSFESFASPFAAPFAPQTGKQLEVGAKMAGTQYSATLAFFQIEQNNVLTSDPSDPTGFYSIPVGVQRSQGVEADVSWRFKSDWHVQASYAYTDASIRKDNTFAEGNRLKNVPVHSGRVWASYHWELGPASAAFGFGVSYSDSLPGDLGNTFSLPGWTTADSMLSLAWNTFQLQLNVSNLTDREYLHRAAFSRNQGVIPGEPRTVSLRARYTF